MKLVRYRNENREDYGALLIDKIVSLSILAESMDIKLPVDIENFIASESQQIGKLEESIQKALEKPHTRLRAQRY